jgi:Acetyltransferase (GNAT) domain
MGRRFSDRTALSLGRTRSDMTRVLSGTGSVRVTTSGSPDRIAWDTALAARGGSVFHSTAWAEYRTLRDEATPVFVQWWSERAADEPIALALGFQRPDPRTLRGRLTGRLEFDSPPASLENYPDLVSPLTRWARRRPGLVELRCGSFDARTAWTPGALPRQTWRYEFVVPAADGAKLLTGMRKGARSSIHKALRIGVEVTACDDHDGLLCFSRLHAATVSRLREMKGVDQPVPDVERMAEELAVLIARNAGRVYLASFAGEPIAGCFFGLFSRSAYYLLSGAVARANGLGATGLALFVALDELAREGYTRLNLGGTAGDADDGQSPEHGLYSFKKGLGGQPVRVAAGRLTLRPLRGKLLSGARRALSGRQ